MVNLLGEAWQHGQPLWERVFNVPEAKLHLYGKHEARAGRKIHLGLAAHRPLRVALRLDLCGEVWRTVEESAGDLR